MTAPSQHAIAKHGSNARTVERRIVNAHPDNVFKGKGKDGRWYTIAQRSSGKAWDVSIDSSDGYNVTKFVCSSRNWVARKLLWLAAMLAVACWVVCSGVV